MSAALKVKHLKRKGHSPQGAGMSDTTVETNEGDVVRPQWEPTWKDFVFIPLAGVSFISLIAWCILFYNWAGMDWLLYLGWAVFVMGIVIIAMNRVALKRRGRASDGGAWLRTTVVVDSGIYAVVRHPMYLGLILRFLAFPGSCCSAMLSGGKINVILKSLAMTTSAICNLYRGLISRWG